MASALVVPDIESLNPSIARTVYETWSCLGYSTTLVDLHQINFDPVIRVERTLPMRTDGILRT